MKSLWNVNLYLGVIHKSISSTIAEFFCLEGGGCSQLSKSTETVAKIIHYYISSYFLRKLTEKLPLGRIFFFCLKSLLFVLQVSLVMSSVTCIWLSYADQQTL